MIFKFRGQGAVQDLDTTLQHSGFVWKGILPKSHVSAFGFPCNQFQEHVPKAVWAKSNGKGNTRKIKIAVQTNV